jgi:hypothetical protein
MRVGFIESIVAIQSNMTSTVANLTYWTVELRVAGREATTRVLGDPQSLSQYGLDAKEE